MSCVLVIENCTVEIELPVLEVAHGEITTRTAPKIKLIPRGTGLASQRAIKDVQVRWGDKTIRIGALVLEVVVGHLLPAEKDGQVIYWTEDEVKPDVEVSR